MKGRKSSENSDDGLGPADRRKSAGDSDIVTDATSQAAIQRGFVPEPGQTIAVPIEFIESDRGWALNGADVRVAEDGTVVVTYPDGGRLLLQPASGIVFERPAPNELVEYPLVSITQLLGREMGDADLAIDESGRVGVVFDDGGAIFFLDTQAYGRVVQSLAEREGETVEDILEAVIRLHVIYRLSAGESGGEEEMELQAHFLTAYDPGELPGGLDGLPGLGDEPYVGPTQGERGEFLPPSGFVGGVPLPGGGGGAGPGNDPTATDDRLETPEDTILKANILANDSDPNGDPLTVVGHSEPANGTVAIEALTGEISYRPDPDYFGPDSFTYTISDGAGGATKSATVDITVTPVNDKPVAVKDVAMTEQAMAVTIPVLANDFDVDGDTLTIVGVSAPSDGSATVDPDTGTVTYTPDPDFKGSDKFAYTIDDGTGATSSAAVIVTVKPANKDPFAADDLATTHEDMAVTIPVLSNDNDPDGDPLTIVGVSAPGDGMAEIDLGGTAVTYTPDPDFNGADSFTYTISDGDGGATKSATVSVVVTPVGDDPVAIDDFAVTIEDHPVMVPVLANDSDADGDLLTIVNVSAPSHGSAVVDPGDATVTYTPAPDYSGPDQFTYTISDGAGGGTKSATVTIAVKEIDETPHARSDTDMVFEGDGATGGNVVTGIDPDDKPSKRGHLRADDQGDEPAILRAVTHDGTTYTLTGDGTGIDISGDASRFMGFSGGVLTIATSLGGVLSIDMNGPSPGSYEYIAPDSAEHSEGIWGVPFNDPQIGHGDGLGAWLDYFEGVAVDAYDAAGAPSSLAVKNVGFSLNGTEFRYAGIGVAGGRDGEVDYLPGQGGEHIELIFESPLGSAIVGLGALFDGTRPGVPFDYGVVEMARWEAFLDGASVGSGMVAGTASGLVTFMVDTAFDKLVLSPAENSPSSDLGGAESDFLLQFVHGAPQDTRSEEFGYTLEDSNGDRSSATLTIDVKDGTKGPHAVDDTARVLAGESTGGNLLANDTLGADVSGAVIHSVKHCGTAFTLANADANGILSISTAGGGILSINLVTGVYSYTAPSYAPFPFAETFEYRLVDGDLDADGAKLTIDVEHAKDHHGGPGFDYVDKAVLAYDDVPADDAGKGSGSKTDPPASHGDGEFVSVMVNGVTHRYDDTGSLMDADGRPHHVGPPGAFGTDPAYEGRLSFHFADDSGPGATGHTYVVDTVLADRPGNPGYLVFDTGSEPDTGSITFTVDEITFLSPLGPGDGLTDGAYIVFGLSEPAGGDGAFNRNMYFDDSAPVFRSADTLGDQYYLLFGGNDGAGRLVIDGGASAGVAAAAEVDGDDVLSVVGDGGRESYLITWQETDDGAAGGCFVAGGGGDTLAIGHILEDVEPVTPGLRRFISPGSGAGDGGSAEPAGADAFAEGILLEGIVGVSIEDLLEDDTVRAEL